MLDTTPEIYYDPNGAYIDSALHANFICPVDVHFFSLNGGGQFTNVLWWAVVDDNHPSLDVSCFLQSCAESGDCNGSELRKLKGVGDKQMLTIVEDDTFDLGAYTHAVTLRCWIPGKFGNDRSGIRKYTVYAVMPK